MQEITLNGKKYPAYQTMGALRRFKQITGLDLATAGADIDHMTTYIYCVLVSACKRDGIPFPYDSVDDFADNLLQDDFTALVKDYFQVDKARGE